MANKYVDLSKAQKEEIRRLTQLANRRIKAAFKAYEKEGISVVPKDVTGNIQIREQWASDQYAISRSVKFESMKAYREQLNYLRSFEKTRPGIKEYTEVQRQKTLQAMETSTGEEVSEAMAAIINKMTAPQLSEFWQKFSNRAAKLGVEYSSGDAMDRALTEYFSEDGQALAAGLATNLKTGQLTQIKQPKKRKKKGG